MRHATLFVMSAVTDALRGLVASRLSLLALLLLVLVQIGPFSRWAPPDTVSALDQARAFHPPPGWDDVVAARNAAARKVRKPRPPIAADAVVGGDSRWDGRKDRYIGQPKVVREAVWKDEDDSTGTLFNPAMIGAVTKITHPDDALSEG